MMFSTCAVSLHPKSRRQFVHDDHLRGEGGRPATPRTAAARPTCCGWCSERFGILTAVRSSAFIVASRIPFRSEDGKGTECPSNSLAARTGSRARPRSSASARFWNTVSIPASRALSGYSNSTSLPSNQIFPEVRFSTPVICRTKVDFPRHCRRRWQRALALAENEVGALQRVQAAVVLGEILRFRIASFIEAPSSPDRGAAQSPLIEHHRANDDHALHHLLIIGVELDRGETRDDHAEDQRPDHRADYRARPPASDRRRSPPWRWRRAGPSPIPACAVRFFEVRRSEPPRPACRRSCRPAPCGGRR